MAQAGPHVPDERDRTISRLEARVSALVRHAEALLNENAVLRVMVAERDEELKALAARLEGQ